jgi:hypothetical protein
MGLVHGLNGRGGVDLHCIRLGARCSRCTPTRQSCKWAARCIPLDEHMSSVAFHGTRMTAWMCIPHETKCGQEDRKV